MSIHTFQLTFICKADAMQVLRYTSDGHQGHGQWYKPHVDWFNSDGYDGHDPLVNNGTNRFATMFLYLSDVEAGGATVFPLSKTHEGYNGEKLVHDGTVNTPGYINTEEARWCCNESSTALRSKPKQGNAVLFYSQGPNGALDPYSYVITQRLIPLLN
jgi:prolyl 4-hydroxylase